MASVGLLHLTSEANLRLPDCHFGLVLALVLWPFEKALKLRELLVNLVIKVLILVLK